MPFLRSRTKLTCFYCNRRSSHQTYTPGLRQWTCTSCSADNFLDSNGEITDPPASLIAGSTARFVQPSQSSQPQTSLFSTHDSDAVTPRNPAKEDDLFCATCQKNQHLYTQSLAAFYPSITTQRGKTPHRTEEEEYERAEKEYRLGLEERFPLICEACEPRVRERLRKVDYEARADHMGRITRALRGNGGRGREQSGWKGWVLWLGRWIWLGSWLCQVLWNVVGLMKLADMGMVFKVSATGCAQYLVSTGEVLPGCLERLEEGPAFYGLLLALMVIWWHPQRLEKLGKRYGRFEGESQYYKLQVVALLVRSAAWFWLTRGPQTDIDSRRAVHLFVLLFSLLVALISYRTVTIDYTPPVSFRTSPEPLIKRNPNHASTSTTLSRPQDRASQPRSFPISSLAPQNTPTQQTPRLPTPPPEADYNDPNSMDWAPTRSSFQPRSAAPIQPSMPMPSPFHGRLPEDVVSPAHRLRNPPNKPNFQAASSIKKASLFTNSSSSTSLPHHNQSNRTNKTGNNANNFPHPSGHPLDLSTLSSALSPSPTSTLFSDMNDDDDNESTYSSPRRPHQSASTFRDPRFFAPGPAGGNEDTGLEGIMERSFRIDEVPREVKDLKEGRDVALVRAVERGQRRSKRVGWWMGLLTVVFAMAFVMMVVREVRDGDGGKAGGLRWGKFDRGGQWERGKGGWDLRRLISRMGM